MAAATDGAFQLGSAGIRFAEITDGLSNTILVGEKHVALNQFGVGWSDCSLYNGDYATCSTRAGGIGYPLATSLTDPGWKFGSYHTNLVQFAWGDGGVRPLPVSIAPYVLGLMTSINDGEVIPDF